ncbi:MAG: choice-of-anchor D domain-containing protein [Blastocatellia bacterium]|nr:choice-of-anchor D domain-containing protein [Blastocatellia bacterium]
MKRIAVSLMAVALLAIVSFAFPVFETFSALSLQITAYFSQTPETAAQTKDGNAPAVTSDLFISEYIEGTSNNKAIEIYNGTGAPVNLATGNYVLQVYFNGAVTASTNINLDGIIAAGDVYVFAHPSANATILAQADGSSSTLSFNGNDAVVLRKGGTAGTVIDSIGQVGFDPITGWGTAPTTTINATLVRKATICTGDTNSTDTFVPSVQWNGFATDTFSNLGSHTASCNSAPVAVDDNLKGAKDTQLNIPAATLTSNDIDPDAGQTLSVSAVQNAINGAVSISAGVVTFTPNAGFTGLASFEYVVSDGTAVDVGIVNLEIIPGISGSVSVGTGQTYTNLTNNDGLFQALNNDLILTGDLTVNITSDLTIETGNNALRNLTEQGAGAGTYRILIKPSGGPRTVSGDIAGELIKLNGADRVTIDGWSGAVLSGPEPEGVAVTRDLTITNTSTNAFASMVFFYNGLGNPSQNNTIQNVNIVGNSTSYAGIAIGGNSGGLGGDNDNNKVLNCSIKSVSFGIYTQGQSEANPNLGTQIVDNVLNFTGADSVRRIGIVAVNEQNIQIRRNQIYVNRGGAPGGAVGIGLGADVDSKFAFNATTSGGIIDAIVAQNRITGVVGSNDYGAHGIAVAGAPSGQNRLTNNMISGVTGAPTSPDLTTGIFIAGVPGSNTYLNYNSVAMTGDRGSGAALPSYALAMSGTDPTVQLKNNIFYTTQVATGGGAGAVSYAIGTGSSTFVNLDSNFNAFYHSGTFGYRVGGLLSGTQITNLADWQGSVSDDANSQEVDPLFVDPTTDLHLQGTSPVLDDAIDVGTVADIDGDPRPIGAGFDIGADERPVSVTYTLSVDPATANESGEPTVTITATGDVPASGNTVVSLTLDPTSTATLADLVGGSIPTEITILDGQSSGSVQINIEDDAVYEGVETAVFKGQIGVSTFTASLTIEDNDVASFPEIDVIGNGVSIADGDVTPSSADHTIFQSVNIVSGTSARTFSIQNTGTGNLNIASITISGVNASEFQLTTPPASTVAPGASTTFTVTFDPTGEGLRNATVNIDSDDADEDPYDFAIRGTGYYVPVLGNYPNSMVGLSGNTTVTPSVPLIYAEQAYAWTSPSFQGQLAVDPATGNVNITNARPAGTYTVNVRAQNGSSYDSTSFTLTVMADECINTSWFVNTANVDVGSNPQNLAVGDFNGDGKQDIVTGNVNDRTLTILLRNAANNGYDSELIGNFNDFPAAIASGDLNNDGRHDLAIVFNSNDEVQLYYRNTANTGFSYGQTLSMNDSPIAVTIADLNGDGRNDIASANSTPGTATVYVRTTANNSFVLENHYSFGSLPYSIVAADLNGDGKTDLAGSNRTNPGGVTVLLRNAANNGYDAEPTVPTGGDLPYSLAAGDLNGDGRQDIVAVNYLGLNASVLYRNAAGTGFIQPAELYDMGGNPRSVALGDFNQDGRLDIVSGNIQNAISVLLRNSANTGYLDRRLFNANDDVIQVAVGDVNGDTIQDVVGVVPGNDQVAIFRGVCVSPEVSVSGNGQNIPDGDATPSPSNNTAFGPVLMDGGSVVKTFTIENTGLDDLEIFSTPRVIVGGLNPTDFSVTVQPNSPITPSGSTTFEVTFNPTGLGLRQAVIYFQNNDRDEEIFDFLVVGTGTRPETTISSLNRTAASPNNANTVSWQAVFNDAVSGVNPTNFNLVNVGLDGSPFVTVAPAGGTTPNTTWNVSASTWTGSGLLGLTLVNDDAVSHTLTNTPFTGEAYVIDRGDPAITYTPLTNAVGPGDRTFSVFGTDNVGINEVRVFWQVNGGSAGYAETQCTQTGGTPQNGMWGCSILDGPGAPQTNPGTVSYWVTAVDAAGNLTASPSDAGPSGGQRNLYTIGSGGSIDVSLFSDFDNVALGSEFTFNGDAEVKQALTLNGLAYTGDYTLALGCNTSVNGAGSASYVVGKVKRRFCATETFEFPVGGPPLGIVIPGGIPADNYSPLTVTITDGIAGSSLTVSVTDGFLPGLLQAGACSRYWTVNETGDLTADLTFKYRDVDDASNEESQWRVYRRGVGFPVEYTPYVNNFAVNQMTAQNVSQFSSWGFGQSLAPTSAPVTISGRVRTLDGRGLKGAIVTMTDGFGVIRQTTTSTFGYYRFEGVSTGESYVLGVSSKRYRFTPMLVNVTEELRDLDFYPDPQ